MKTFPFLAAFFLATAAISCSDDDNNQYVAPPPAVSAETVAATGFSYKQFFQENDSDGTRKGIVILAHGDGGDENDFILNDQCTTLAQYGYVAITTSYVQPAEGADQASVNAAFKANIEEVIANATADFGIPRSKVIIGGSSRGGNNTFALILPAQDGITPIQGIKGAILQCSGGDTWKGSAVLFPVAYMSNLVDDVMGSNANDFKSGLADNANDGVSAMSECFIVNSTGHCSDSYTYKPFLVQKVLQWLP